MRRAARTATLTTAGFVLAGAMATGCASPTLTQNVHVMYTCCATDVGTSTWQPGQPVRITWIRQGQPARGALPTTLTAVLTGPYRSVSALKDANKAGPDPSRVVATAPVIHTTARSPISVVTIPPGAAPGYYNLSTSAGVAGISGSGATIITVG